MKIFAVVGAFLLVSACGGTPASTGAADATADVAAADVSGEVAGTDATQAETQGETQGDTTTLPAVATDTVGGARPAAVAVPDAWTPDKKWPLILVLHGYSASGLVQSAFLGIAARTNDFGYVAIAPDGTLDSSGNLFWNATAACCDFGHIGVDDVTYLTGLIDEAIAKLAVDPKRVYVVGHSNGGFMAYRLACEKSDKIAAIAVIAGAVDPDFNACVAPKPVSVLHIHGTKDTSVLYGGEGSGKTGYPSAEGSIGQWTKRDGCGGTTSELGTSDFDAVVDGSETTRISYGGCPSGVVVEQWKMVNSGHIPGFTDEFRDALAGWLTARGKVE